MSLSNFQKPFNWPKSFKYSPLSQAMNIHENMLRACLSTGDPQDLEIISPLIEMGRVHSHLQIRKITDKKHPLFGKDVFKGHPQHGVFAIEKIAAGTELGEYVGETTLGDKQSKFDAGVYCWVVSIHNFKIQVYSRWLSNELTFVNDYRGIRELPNVRTKLIVHRGSYYFGYETFRDVAPGEELLVDYGHKHSWSVSQDS